jgi:hypothetical protein
MPRGSADLRNHGAADGFSGAGPPDMLCAAAQRASPLSGMAAMYWLMSAFHSAPWLKLISSGYRTRENSVHGFDDHHTRNP